MTDRRWLKRPIDLPAVLGRVAVILLLTAVVIAMVLQYRAGENRLAEKDEEIAGLRTELDARAAVSDCRSALAAAVSDETSSFLLALGDLVTSLPSDDRGVIGAALLALDAAGDELDAARDARVAFEQDPKACPP